MFFYLDATRMSAESSTGIKPSGERPENAPAAATGRREVESATLLAGGRELLIRHGGEVYMLRQTSKGKLILTK
jgi:hemin uptake protein HemP